MYDWTKLGGFFSVIFVFQPSALCHVVPEGMVTHS